jgi:hypothetical protein
MRTGSYGAVPGRVINASLELQSPPPLKLDVLNVQDKLSSAAWSQLGNK